MPSLDALISQWTDQLRATHPELVPHPGEPADHVHSSDADLDLDIGSVVVDLPE